MKMRASDAGQEELRRDIFRLSEKATRLKNLAHTLKGKLAYDSPPKKPYKPRNDHVDFISSVPIAQSELQGADSDSEDEGDQKLSGWEVETFRRNREARKPHRVLKSTMLL